MVFEEDALRALKRHSLTLRVLEFNCVRANDLFIPIMASEPFFNGTSALGTNGHSDGASDIAGALRTAMFWQNRSKTARRAASRRTRHFLRTTTSATRPAA